MKIHGLYTVLVTPFHADGSLDEEGLRHNIRFQLQNHIDGLVTLGTTSESPTLTASEKQRIAAICLEEIKGQVPLMIGTGSYSTKQTIESTQIAQSEGASSALIVTPYYNKPTQEGLYRHFKAVAASVDLPIVVYNIAGRTGQNLATDTLSRLAEIPNIVGVKEASGNLHQIMDVIELMRNVRPDFSIMSGDDALTLPVLTLGGHGIFSVLSNLIPERIKEMIAHFQVGNLSMAQDIHYELYPLFKGAFIETNPIPIKKAMGLWGMAAGPCRLPLCEMTPENEKKWTQLLTHYQTANIHG